MTTAHHNETEYGTAGVAASGRSGFCVGLLRTSARLLRLLP